MLWNRPPWDSPPSLAWEAVVEEGEVVGVICPDCFTMRERRSRRFERDSLIRRLKRGLPPSVGPG